MSHKDTNNEDQLTAERDAMEESEAVTAKNVDDASAEEEASVEIEHSAQADQAIPAELAAVHTDTESAKEAEGELIDTPDQVDEAETEKPKKAAAKKTVEKADKPTKTVAAKASSRSQRYLATLKNFDSSREYTPAEAIKIVAETAGDRDQSLEVHVRLLAPKSKKGETDRFRTVVTLPHGTGKELKIAVLDDDLIAEIAKAGDTKYDVLLATPAMMPKVAKIAKILGPKNKMPNPKTGTVVENTDDAKKAIASGRIELRADAHHNLHQVIGRTSWPKEKLLENLKTLRASLPAHRLQRMVVCATFGPGVAIDLAA